MYKNRSHDSCLKMSAGLWAVLCMPGALNLAVYYSFAMRMHSALGGWPDVIGMAQVPEELMAHYGWMTNLFVINLFFSLYTPIGVVLVG
ncbi:MAG: hypothetical protein QGF46_03790, partial [Planctomycetota bacterium]|nr:hypothetical protein [Planctomycetota bacterium]